MFFRTAGRRYWMILTAVVWLLSTFVQQWHERTVLHVRCIEHGDVMEIQQADFHAGAHSDRDIATAAMPDHSDGCNFPPLPPLQNPDLSLATIEEAEPLARPPALPPDLAYFTSPLRFAPKTSPPARQS